MPFGWVCFSNKAMKNAQCAQECSTSQLPFGWVCFSNERRLMAVCGQEITGSQLPFGWVCFSNFAAWNIQRTPEGGSQLPFGWVCFSNAVSRRGNAGANSRGLNCLSAGSVSLTSQTVAQVCRKRCRSLNCLSAGSVSLTLFRLARTSYF